jgi:hypothetical protein
MIWEQEPYVTYSSFTMMTGWRRWSVWQSLYWRRRPSARDRWRGRRAVVKKLPKRASSREDCFLKNLIRPLSMQDRWGRRFRRPALLIADTHRWTGWSSLGDAAAEAARPRFVGVFMAVGLLLFLWRPHVYIGKICLGLQRPVTD